MKQLFAILVLMGLGTHLQAQVWSLNKCIVYAMENNLTIKQTMVNVDLAKIDESDSKYSRLPNLNASTQQTHTYGRSLNPITNVYVANDVNSYNINLNSSMTVFNFFSLTNTYKSRVENVEAEKQNLEQLKNDIALNVINNYLNVLYNQELLIVAKQQLEVINLQLDRATKNLNAGNATEGDVLNLKSQVATEELNVTTTQNSLDIAKLNLIQLLDRDPGEPFEVEKPENVDQFLLVGVVGNLKEVYEQAEKNLPNVRLMEYRYKAAEYSLKSAKGARLPSIGFSAGMNTDYADINPSAVSDQFRNNFGQFWAFSLRIPIFNGLSGSNNVKRANLQLQTAELNMQNAKLELSKTVQQAIADVKAAQKKYESTSKSTTSLKEAFKYSQQRFDVGLINVIDYNLAKNDVSRAEANLIQAKYELIFRVKLLDFYNGKPLSF